MAEERIMEYEPPFLVIEEDSPGIELYDTLEDVELDLEPPDVESGYFRVFDIEGREFKPVVDPAEGWTVLQPATSTRESKSFLERHLRGRVSAALELDTSTMELDERLRRVGEAHSRGRRLF
jgi:hypothetical protein